MTSPVNPSLQDIMRSQIAKAGFECPYGPIDQRPSAVICVRPLRRWYHFFASGY